MTPQSNFTTGTSDQLEAHVTDVHVNTDQAMIVVTEDKARLCLIRNFKYLRTNDWLGPLGVFLTIAITFPTAEYRDALRMKAEFWRACFVISGILSFAWLIWSLVKWSQKKNLETVQEEIINSLKPPAQKSAELEV